MILTDSIEKVSENILVTIVTNGYLIEVSGPNSEGNWQILKLVCANEAELLDIFNQAIALPRN